MLYVKFDRNNRLYYLVILEKKICESRQCSCSYCLSMERDFPLHLSKQQLSLFKDRMRFVALRRILFTQASFLLRLVVSYKEYQEEEEEEEEG